jgi:hypothetical protein
MALGNIGPDAQAAVPVLIRMLQERPDSDTGWLSAEAVGKIARPDDAAAWAALKKASESSNWDLAERAKFGLEAMTSRARGTPADPPSMNARQP